MEPVDLTNLRSMTDGDAEMEKELFKEFFTSFEAGMASLQANVGEAAAEAWRKEAHALKGISLNLGAMTLGNLCKEAETQSQAAPETKKEFLKNLSVEYAQVQGFLRKALST